MDAGLAAVIAGASGAGGAALAAFATSYGLLRQARLQGDNAHRLWLRNHQQQALEECLIAINNFRACFTDRTSLTANTPPGGDAHPDLRPVFAEHQAASRAMSDAITRVTLIADLKTGRLAMTAGTAMHKLGQEELHATVAEVTPMQAPPAEESLVQLRAAALDALREFTLAAQQSLQKG